MFWYTYESVQKTGKLAKDEAIHVDVLMCKALFEAELFDEQDMREIALLDWEREEGSAVEETKNEFVSSMNEVHTSI